MLPGADLQVVNIFKEFVLHSVMKDIKVAVKEAVVQWRHNLYRDSIILANSNPNCTFWVKSFPLIGPGSMEPRRRWAELVRMARVRMRAWSPRRGGR